MKVKGRILCINIMFIKNISKYLLNMNQTEEKILKATLVVLGQDGYDKATTRKIASEAGVSEVTLFRKFKNKENLIREAYKQSLQKTMVDMDAILAFDDKANLESNLVSLHEKLFNGIDERTSSLILQMRRVLINQNMILNQDPKNTYLTLMRKRLASYFEQQIALGNMRQINPDAAALIFFSVITFEKLLMKSIHDETSGIPPEDFLDIFIKGIGL